MRAWAPLVLIPLATACAAGEPTALVAAPAPAGFKPSELRQPAVFVRVAVALGAFGTRERTSLPAIYEGALLDGLNARAVLPRDTQRVTDARLDPRLALARAREVGADHAVLVDVTVERGEPEFCRESPRRFRASATTWIQTAEVLRSSDGATRLRLSGPALTVTDVQPDCNAPRASHRRSSSETAAEGVTRLLTRLLGP